MPNWVYAIFNTLLVISIVGFLVLALGTLLLALCLTALPAAAADKPNILLIVGDDIGFGDLGISGSVTRTPNLDRLAKRGTFFTNFHVSPVRSMAKSASVWPGPATEMRVTSSSLNGFAR